MSPPPPPPPQLGQHCSELKDVHLGQCYNISDEGMVALARGCPKLHRIYMQENKLVSSNCPFSSLTPHHCCEARRVVNDLCLEVFVCACVWKLSSEACSKGFVPLARATQNSTCKKKSC